MYRSHDRRDTHRSNAPTKSIGHRYIHLCRHVGYQRWSFGCTRWTSHEWKDHWKAGLQECRSGSFGRLLHVQHHLLVRPLLCLTRCELINRFTYTPLQGVIPVESLETTTRAKGLAGSGIIVSAFGFINSFAGPYALGNIGYVQSRFCFRLSLIDQLSIRIRIRRMGCYRVRSLVHVRVSQPSTLRMTILIKQCRVSG